MPQYKRCYKCGIVKEVCEFSKNQCKKCIAEYNKQYYQENKEKASEYSKQYYQENKEKRAEYDKQYRQENREKKAEYMKQWRQENREKKAEYDKQYYQTPNGKKANLKQYNKRKRNLGFEIIFDNIFPVSLPVEYHHISEGFVFAIPKFIHKQYYTGCDKQKHRELLMPIVEILYNISGITIIDE
jgi:hypothetical protein